MQSGNVQEPVANTLVGAVWTFERRGDRLTVRREAGDEAAFQLLVIENGRARTFTFTEIDRLVAFQHDMETFLVRTGWLLVDFAPDRRRGRDRRGFPRIDPDRRRWWTDVPDR